MANKNQIYSAKRTLKQLSNFCEEIIKQFEDTNDHETQGFRDAIEIVAEFLFLSEQNERNAL
jgi:hypothetical protein